MKLTGLLGQVQALYDTIDGRRDPNPDKAKIMTDRVRGEVLLESVPSKAKKLTNRIRIWQIKPALLEANPHWISTGRIAKNGMAWGDEEDPVDVDVEKAKIKSGVAKKRLMEIGKGRKRKRRDEGGTQSSNIKIKWYSHYSAVCPPLMA